MNKKGQGISMTYIIVAALALVVLVVMVLYFTGALGTMLQSQKDTVKGATDQQMEIWRGQCKLYCSLGQKENFIAKEFEGPDDRTYSCGGKADTENLNVDCGECTGTADTGKKPCAQRTSAECGTEGCTWEPWK